MVYENKLAAVYAKARRQMQQFFDGVCTFYTLQVREVAGICYGGSSDWEAAVDLTDLPCRLAFEQKAPAQTGAEADGSSVEARCRLFLADSVADLPAGSRVRVEQQGQVFWLACSGLPAKYPTHWEVDVRLLDERA